MSSKRCLAYIITKEYSEHMHISSSSYFAHNRDLPVSLEVLEVATAHECITARPQFVLDLFNKGYDQVLFLGADVMFYDDVEHLWIESYFEYDAMITPHMNRAWLEPERFAWMRLTGMYNSDFVMWMHGDNTRKFLMWQKIMMQGLCISEPHSGVFLDQGYLDMLPIRTRCKIIKDEDINTAYYNLHERQGVRPAVFQFSGWQRSRPGTLSKYMREEDKKFITADIAKLLVDYARRFST